MTIRAWVTVAFLFACHGSANAEQVGEAQRRANTATSVAVYMEACIGTDKLLRGLCQKFRPHLSDANKPYCELPEQTFESRTAGRYGRFQEQYAKELSSQKGAIAEGIEKGRKAFERQFPQAVAGKLTGFELESLSRQMREHCAAVESEWLSRIKE